jgi:TolB-like protein
MRSFVMKKVFLGIGVLLVMGGAYAQQQLTVAVSPFELRGGFTQDDANAVYELFVGELAAAGTVRVVDRGSFDKIMAELQFQQSDWTSGNRVAEFGKALGADSIIRGQLMTLAGKLIITAGVLDITTAQILSTGRLQLNNLGEVFDKLPGFARDTVKALPKPVYKIGDTGPGGGIVFVLEGNTGMEVSRLLGDYTWNEAVNAARNYRGGGYSDWHLPSLSLLNLIYNNLQKAGVVDLGGTMYWSTSEYSGGRDAAWALYFTDGSPHNYGKNYSIPVRAVRAF